MPSRFDEHPARREDATPVLFIGATGRCGSTLLDRILGQHPAVFAAGELNRLWEFGLRGRGPCGCGAALIECPVWGQILEQVYGSVAAALEAAAGNEASERLLRTPHLPRTMGARWPSFLDLMDDLARQAEALYDAIRQVTGCRLVVDASKHPTFGAIARSRPGVDMRVLHMIRDPRASAFSWSRPKPDRGDRSGESMWHGGPMRTTASWVLLNRDHHEFGDRHPDRYRLLRYEDFVASPADALLTIGELVAMDFAGLVRAGDPPSAELAPTHSAWGNPDRFETGPVAIVEDERWKQEMTRLARLKTVAVAAPWMGRYGYSRATRGRMSPRVGDDRTRGHR